MPLNLVMAQLVRDARSRNKPRSMSRTDEVKLVRRLTQQRSQFDIKVPKHFGMPFTLNCCPTAKKDFVIRKIPHKKSIYSKSTSKKSSSRRSFSDKLRGKVSLTRKMFLSKDDIFGADSFQTGPIFLKDMSKSLIIDIFE